MRQHIPDRSRHLVRYYGRACPRLVVSCGVGADGIKSYIDRIGLSKGGVPKRRVPEATVGPNGLEGDQVDHPGIHGGPERAVSLFSRELIDALREEGHPIAPGSTGENLTLSGVDWSSMTPGSRWKMGDALELEVTRQATPCATIAASFQGRDFMRISGERHPGWSRVYARVITPGRIREGDAVVPLDRTDLDREAQNSGA